MSPLFRILATLSVAFVVVAAHPSSPAEAALKAIWGPLTLPDGTSAFPVYDRLGVEVLQQQIRWREVAITPRAPPGPGRPRVPVAEVGRYRGRRGRPATASGRRSWSGTRPTGPTAIAGRSGSPGAVGDYADFTIAAARRYRTVRHWMIWGEPTRGDTFKPMPPNAKRGPRAYARLLDHAYGALKRVRRSNVVIGGMTWTGGVVSPVKFIRWMRLPNGRRPRLDWFGHNPFSARFPRLSRTPYAPGIRDFSDIDSLHGQLRREYPRPTPRLWLSEFSVSARRSNRAFAFHVSEREQARWLRAACRIASRQRYVAGLGWYTLLDEPEAPGSLTSGLLDSRGRPKPAYSAYRNTC